MSMMLVLRIRELYCQEQTHSILSSIPNFPLVLLNVTLVVIVRLRQSLPCVFCLLHFPCNVISLVIQFGNDAF